MAFIKNYWLQNLSGQEGYLQIQHSNACMLKLKETNTVTLHHFLVSYLSRAEQSFINWYESIYDRPIGVLATVKSIQST